MQRRLFSTLTNKKLKLQKDQVLKMLKGKPKKTQKVDQEYASQLEEDAYFDRNLN